MNSGGEIPRGDYPPYDKLSGTAPSHPLQPNRPLARSDEYEQRGDEPGVSRNVAIDGLAWTTCPQAPPFPYPSAEAVVPPPRIARPQPAPNSTEMPDKPHSPEMVMREPTASPDSEPKKQLTSVQRQIGTAVSGTTLNERHPDWPPVKLHLHQGPHVTPKHFAALPKLMEDADVYCHENLAGDHLVQGLTEVSNLPLNNSTMTVEDVVNLLPMGNKPIRGTHIEMPVRAIAGRGVAIGHFDLRPDQDDPNLIDGYFGPETDLSTLKATVDETIQHQTSAATALASLNKQRDKIMLGPVIADDSGQVTAGRFEQEMERIFAENPELLKKSEVRVVDTHGAGHTSMLHRARAAGVDAVRSFPEMPFVYRPTVELMRKIEMGKEPTRKFLVQCVADETIRDVLNFTVGLRSIGDDPDVVEYIRARSASLNENETQKLLDAKTRDSPNSHEPPLKAISLLDKMLRDKGLGPVPWSKAEIYDDLARRDAELAQKKAQLQQESKARRTGPEH